MSHRKAFPCFVFLVPASTLRYPRGSQTIPQEKSQGCQGCSEDGGSYSLPAAGPQQDGITQITQGFPNAASHSTGHQASFFLKTQRVTWKKRREARTQTPGTSVGSEYCWISSSSLVGQNISIKYWSFLLAVYHSGSQPVGLNTFMAEQPFHNGRLRAPKHTNIYIMIPNSNTLELWSSNENEFTVGGHHEELY